MVQQWSDKYAVGIAQIDNQHRRFFEGAQKLADDVLNCAGEEAVEGSLAFLRRYASEHFADEEALMEKCGFPGLDAHKGLHAEFIESLEHLVEDYDIYRAPTQDMANDILEMTQGWLIEHILNEDVQYVSYVEES
jgi:hemerythrin